MAATRHAAFRSSRSLILTYCALLIVAAPLPLAAETIYWTRPAGDPGNWSDAVNWNPSQEPGASDRVYIRNGGTAVIDQPDETCSRLYLGQAGGKTGYGEMTGGSLAVADSGGPIFILGGAFSQGGSSTVRMSSLYLEAADGEARYNLTGGLLAVDTWTQVGYSATGSGTFAHTGGTHTIRGTLVICRRDGSAGTYELSGTGHVQSNRLYVCKDSSTEQDLAATGLFREAGGTYVVDYVSIGTAGRYEHLGGVLDIGAGLHNEGTFVFDDGAVMNANSGLVDLSTGTFEYPGSATLNVAAGTILTIPPGFDPYLAFGSYSNSGKTHVRGTTLTIAASDQIDGRGHIYDHVACLGSLTPASGSIHLYAGVSVPGGGVVDLGGGTLRVEDTVSGVTGGSLVCGKQYIGYSGVAAFVLNGGSHEASELFLGYEEGSRGTYDLQDGHLTTTELNEDTSQAVGYYGDAEFTQTGGTHTARGLLGIAYGDTSTASYSLSSGVLETCDTLVGGQGKGTFTQTGGTHTVTYRMSLGSQLGGEGSYSLSKGNLAVGGSEYIGSSGYSPLGGTGEFTQTGGTHSVGDELVLGYRSDSRGTYTLSAGDLSVVWDETIGYSGTAEFIQNGGTHVVGDELWIGRGPTGSGTFSIGPGTLRALGGLMVASYTGSGTFNITSPLADIEVEERLDFGAGATFTAVEGATIRVTAPAHHSYYALANRSRNPTALAGLENLSLVVESGTEKWMKFEVAGQDRGTVPGAWTDNFALRALTVGTGESPAKVLLVSESDNQPGGLAEAHYGHDLTIGPDSALDTAGFRLYLNAQYTNDGVIDLDYGGLTVLYSGASPFDEIHASVASGYHGGAWDGTGIHSSAAADDPQGLTAVGVIDDGEKVIVDYTWAGDANLDGVLDTNDYDRINTNWLLWTQEGTVPAGGFCWAVGDFNLDGTIDTNDYDKINNAWLLSGSAPLGGLGAPVPTPEPATLLLLALGGLTLIGRKPRS